jgi:hypothetical protein
MTDETFLTPVASGFEGCEPEPDDLLTREEVEAVDARLTELRHWRARSAVSAHGYVIR